MISDEMLWNQKDLPNPPINSYKPTNITFDNIQKLRHAVQEGFDHFKHDKLLKMETAILQRILYRMSTKFRSGKDFKMMKKLNHCLQIYFSNNISRHFVDMLHLIPKNNINNLYLPTKNMLLYILVRLQGFSKLMQRIYECCHIVAVEVHQRLYIGHFWKILLILFALVSRITALVRHNTKFICHIYGKLLPYASKLENSGKNWLPEDYVLPTDLRIWLDVDWVYEDDFVDLTYEPSNDVINIFDLVKDDEDDDILFCDEYILLDDEEKQIEKDFKKLLPLKETLKRTRQFSITEEDIDIIDLSENTSNMEVLEEVDEIDEGNVSSNETILKDMEATFKSDQELHTSFNQNVDAEDVGEEIVNINDSFIAFNVENSDDRIPKNSDDIEEIRVERGSGVFSSGSTLPTQQAKTEKKKNGENKLKPLFVQENREKQPIKRKINDIEKEGAKKTKTEATFVEKVKGKSELKKRKKKHQESTPTSYVDRENISPMSISDSESSVIILEKKDGTAVNSIQEDHKRKATSSDSDESIVFVSLNSRKSEKDKKINRKRNPSFVSAVSNKKRNNKNKKNTQVKQPKHEKDKLTARTQKVKKKTKKMRSK